MFAHMRLLITLCILLSNIESILNYPLQNAEHIIKHTRNIDDELLLNNNAAYECKYSDLCILLKDNQNGSNDNDNDDGNNNESLMDTTRNDDLIFLAERPIPLPIQQQQKQQHQKQKQKQEQQSTEVHHQIDLLTSAEEDALASSSSSSSSVSVTASLEHTDSSGSSSSNGNGNGNNAGNIETIPHEIELRIDNNTHTPRMPPKTTTLTPTPTIDMNDFVTLIPVAEVKSIAANYFRNDAEVQRAYAYLSSQNFAILRQQIINIPEMSAFLIYLNDSGLDLVRLLYAITNLTSKPHELETIKPEEEVEEEKVELEEEEVEEEKIKAGSSENNFKLIAGNEIVRTLHITTTPTAETETKTAVTATSLTSAIKTTTILKIATTTTQPVDDSTTETNEQLNGLHGLVDSILEILPQDQILAIFFDKLETNEQFSKLVDSISSPAFAKILNNMQNSVPLRNLIFALHNNGIYITRIVDSLKAYFFLGSF